MTREEQLALNFGRIELLDLMEYAFRIHPNVMSPLYLEHNARDARAVRFVFSGDTFRCSNCLEVDQVLRKLLISTPAANALTTLFMCAYELRRLKSVPATSVQPEAL